MLAVVRDALLMVILRNHSTRNRSFEESAIERTYGLECVGWDGMVYRVHNELGAMHQKRLVSDIGHSNIADAVALRLVQAHLWNDDVWVYFDSDVHEQATVVAVVDWNARVSECRDLVTLG